MPTFQILYLRENILDHSRNVELRDLLEAIDLATEKAADLTAEIRHNGTRVGLIGPSLSQAAIRSTELGTTDTPHPPECEIAEEMKVRLRMVR